MDCEHRERFSLYRRASRMKGRGFVPDAERCSDCGALLERKATARKG